MKNRSWRETSLEFWIWTALMAALLICLGVWTSRGGDITPGYTFSDNETDPNSLVTSNTLDQLVSAATLRTNAITDRTEVTSTGTNFWLLVLGTNGLHKVQLLNLPPTNGVRAYALDTNAVAGWAVQSNALQNFHLLTNWLDGVTVNTNLTINMPTNAPGTNEFILSARSLNTGTNGIPTNTALAITPLASLYANTNFTAAVDARVVAVAATNRFVATNLWNTNRWVAAHGLGAVPGRVRGVLLCVTNEGIFTVGDEVDVDGVQNNSGQFTGNFSLSANATNVTLAAFYRPGQGFDIYAPTNGSASWHVFTTNNWKLKIYAEP